MMAVVVADVWLRLMNSHWREKDSIKSNQLLWSLKFINHTENRERWHQRTNVMKGPGISGYGRVSMGSII
jgi:hypothetical protein